MAIFRKIHTSFWSDAFVQDLTPEQKYFYLYLLTNEKTSQCGIYEISKRRICYDTGYNIDTVSKLLEYFTKVGKIRYSLSTNEIAIKNWDKYNKSDSPKVQVFVKQQLSSVKDKDLIQYLYCTDTDSLIRRRIEEEREKEEELDKHINKAPKKEDFMQFVKERCAAIGEKYELHEKGASTKYDAWVQNGWKDLKGNKIGNWKSKIVSNLQYFKSASGMIFSGGVSQSGAYEPENGTNYAKIDGL